MELRDADRYRIIVGTGPSHWPVPFEDVPLDRGMYARADLPFILRPDGDYDVSLNSFFSDSAVALRKTSTLTAYARQIAAFLDFMWHRRSGPSGRRGWRDVTTDDRSAYFHWRNMDPDGPRVAASTWNSEVTAINQFFQHQVAVGNLTSSPVRMVTKFRQRSARGSREAVVGVGEMRRPKKPGAPWFAPREYHTWCNVGLRGFGPGGTRDPSFRGEQSARNAVFADMMFGTGLRLAEQASLTALEMPQPDGSRLYSRLNVPDSIAKNESGRFVLVTQRVLRAIDTYQLAERAEAVEMAQRTGAYNLLTDMVIVDDDGSFFNAHGYRVNLDEASPSERQRLFRQTSAGVEPLALWLTRDGLPMKSRTWQTIFKAANARVSKFDLGLRCNAHKLRHSWATVTLAQLQRRYNHYRSSAVPGTAIGDPLNWVSRRLGHRSIETTLKYIHNLEELETETILALIPDTLELVAAPQGADISTDERGLRIE